jgi:hypothetical protein
VAVALRVERDDRAHRHHGAQPAPKWRRRRSRHRGDEAGWLREAVWDASSTAVIAEGQAGGTSRVLGERKRS